MLRHHRIMYFCTLVRKVLIHHQLLIRKFSATRRLVIKELNWVKPISCNRCLIIEVKLLMSIMRYVRLHQNLYTMGLLNSIPTMHFSYENCIWYKLLSPTWDKKQCIMGYSLTFPIWSFWLFSTCQDEQSQSWFPQMHERASNLSYF